MGKVKVKMTVGATIGRPAEKGSVSTEGSGESENSYCRAADGRPYIQVTQIFTTARTPILSERPGRQQ